MTCFDGLEWDCFTGEYGSPPVGAEGGTARYLPVTALKYGAASALQPRMREDNQLRLEVERISAEITGS
ncbi:MAG: hypothetical protein JWR48_612 [Mycobacterium sp.]|nr:hypothetical protein [Mycobacterium sp.]